MAETPQPRDIERQLVPSETHPKSLLSAMASIRTVSPDSRSQDRITSRFRWGFPTEKRRNSHHVSEDAGKLWPALQSIFPSISADPNTSGCGMQWYSYWIEAQLEGLSRSALPLLFDDDHQGGISPQFQIAFFEVAKISRSSEYPSIDSIIDSLALQGIIESAGTDSLLEARRLVFAILGWQTMLFKPALAAYPPQQLAVVDEQDGYRGEAFMALRQSHTCAKRPLHEFLMGFGILLPPRNFCTTVNPEEKSAFNDLKSVEPASFNAFLLCSIGHFKIKWVDVVSCHLEFDERTKILYLYQYPSFCLACGAVGLGQQTESVIHAAASPPGSSQQWAKTRDVTRMLHETLLSYRLLFGQNKKARKLFRNIDPFAAVPEGCKDHSLLALCGRRSYSMTVAQGDKNSYDLQQDFPILRNKITRLHKALSASRPRSWRELWSDKRDSAGWLTFWAVIIFGGLAILLAFVQVLLQIVQIAMNP